MMYRRFKSGDQRNESKDPQIQNATAQVEKQSESESDPEIERQVSEVWERITAVCSQSNASGQRLKHASESKQSTKLKLSGSWQTVRVFVSSTFNDFFSEREVLVKKVFPELREWCHDRRLKLVECDLRWGVPKDATSTQALLTCLEEIDRCYEDNGHPFFLNMLGERYGWIPNKEEVPPEIHSKYTWVDDASMTFMEILHGVLRISNPNAAFFLRDPEFIVQLPDPHRARFEGESALAKEHMKVLKSYLKEQYPHQVFSYHIQYGGQSHTTGRELVNLTNLDQFADQVKEFFKTAMDKAYPLEDSGEEMSPEEKEQELQWLFIKDKADSLIGRDDQLQLLMSYVRGAPDDGLPKIDGKESTMRKAEDWDIEEGDNRLCVVTAQGGWGKTALLAGLVNQAKQEGVEVFYHFVGSTATSGSHDTLLHRLLWSLATDKNDPALDVEADTNTKKSHLRKLLAAWRETKQRMLIVIDGVNELDNSGSVYHLSWLPPALPPGVGCVVSANVSHLPTTARLYEHPAYRLSVGALDSPALCRLADRFFDQYGKKLERTQLQQLVELTRVENPLWMTLMCEELRVFGDFRMMDDKLRALPDAMDAFLATVIGRLLGEDDTGYVKKTLFLMAASTTGLPTDHILRVLGDAESKTECPPLYWAQARRVLKPYSRTVRSAQDGAEYFTFVHEAMWKAVQQCMKAGGEDAKVWHKLLADFYQYSCDNLVLRVNYLPLQLHYAALPLRLIDFMRHDPHAADIPGFQRSRLLSEYRCRSPCDTMPGTREVMMCMGCSHRTRGYNPGVTHLNKDVCYVCFAMVFPSITNRPTARMCASHAMRSGMGPHVSKCCVCDQVMMNTKGVRRVTGPVAAVLCQRCGFGIEGKMCCMFKDFLS